MEPLLQISHLTKNFSDGKEDEYKAVDDVSFELFPGEKLAIIGERKRKDDGCKYDHQAS